jgi:hypothetical protein
MRCVALALVVLWAAACSTSSAPAERVTTWRSLGSWSGRGNQQLETFPIQGGAMRLYWETANEAEAGKGYLKVRLQSGDSGRVLAEPIDARGVGRDTANLVVEHHRVYLTVESAGVDWSIRAEEAVTRAQ